MKSGRTSGYRAMLIFFLIWALFPDVARAEPSPSMSHIPFLWLCVFVVAFLVASVPLLVRKFIRPRGPGWAYWVAAALMWLLFLIFMGPIIVGLGSIVITGRTM